MDSALPGVDVQPASRAERPRLFFANAVRRFFARRLVVLGVVLVSFLVLLGAFGRFIAPYNPLAQDLVNVLTPPTMRHWLGTDELGRDILSRLLWGSSVSLQVGIASVLMASIPGVFVGLVVAYRGGWLDSVVMRVLDGLMALPSLEDVFSQLAVHEDVEGIATQLVDVARL